MTGLIMQDDAYGEDVRGYTEYLGVTIVNDTELVGVQRAKPPSPPSQVTRMASPSR